MANRIRKFVTKEGRPPAAFGYGRVSTDTQAIEGQSLAAQQQSCQLYHAANLGHINWGGFYADPQGVSASKTRFLDREVTRKMLAVLRKGDHLIVDKVDRIFRRLQDFVVTIQYFQQIGVSLHVCNMLGVSIDTNSPMGSFVLNLIVLIAELESKMIGQRIYQVARYLKFNSPCLGFIRRTDVPHHQRGIFQNSKRGLQSDPWVKDPVEWDLLMRIWKMRFEQKMFYREIKEAIIPYSAETYGEHEYPAKYWILSTVWRWVHMADILLDCEKQMAVEQISWTAALYARQDRVKRIVAKKSYDVKHPRRYFGKKINGVQHLPAAHENTQIAEWYARYMKESGHELRK